jgi:DNA polymerase-3 subunit alpha
MAALLTADAGNMDKLTEALEECRRMEIPVLKPDINHSVPDFRVEGDGIRFGLTSVKGVGRPAAEAVVQARAEGPFVSVFDVAGRTETRLANKLTLEALIKAGACDDLGGHRAQLVAALDPALRAGASEQADRRAGQMSLLGEAVQAAAPQPTLPAVAPWSEAEQLRFERDTTGRYWSSHPLAEHDALVRTFGSHTSRTVRECREGAEVVLGGLVVGLQERVIRTGRNEGKRMARFRIEDFDGTIDAVMFSEAFQRHRDVLAENEVLFCSGDVDAAREEICIRVGSVCRPDVAPHELAGLVRIDLGPATPLPALQQVLERHAGTCPVYLTLEPEPGTRMVVRADDAYRVDPTPDFVAAAREVAGENAVLLRRK